MHPPGASFISKFLVASVNIGYPIKCSGSTVGILIACILKVLCHFITRTAFEEQEFDDGTMLVSIDIFQF
jgi:hypothetical protein